MTPVAASPPVTAAQEWRASGMIVLAAMVGLSLSAIPTTTLGLFMDPIQDELGWTRTEISLGLSIYALISVPLVPLSGLLVDKYGPRWIAIPGVALGATVLASFSLIEDSYIHWVLTWVLYSFAAIGMRTVVWNTAVSRVFVVSRGMAIAVLLCGTALSTAFGPMLAHWLIEHWGWRGGYLGIGILWGGLTLLLILLFFDRKPAEPAVIAGSASSAIAARPLTGLTVREALRRVTFYRVALAMFILSTMGAAIAVHLVPMLNEKGLSRAEAAGMAAIIGAGSIIGKIVTGSLVDRFAGSLIPVATFSCPVIAYLLILQPSESVWLLSIAVFVFGYCTGASLHLTTYLTTRYAGMRNFGTIFGLMSTVLSLSAAVGPPLAGVIFDTTGSYEGLQMLGIPLSLLAGALVFGLGPYPVFKAETEEPPSEPNPALA